VSANIGTESQMVEEFVLVGAWQPRRYRQRDRDQKWWRVSPAN